MRDQTLMLKIALPLAMALAGSLPAAAEQDPSASSRAASGAAQATASAEKSVRTIVATVRRQLADPAEPFGLLVILRVKPGQIDRVLASYALQKAQADANSGNLVYHVSGNAADPNQIVVYERWSGFDAFRRHETSPETLAHFVRVAASLENQRSLTVLLDRKSR